MSRYTQSYLNCLLAMFMASSLLNATKSKAAVEFEGVYAPQSGMTIAAEHPYRKALCLNGLWDFQGATTPQGWVPQKGNPPALPSVDEQAWEDVKLKVPSPWNVNGFNKNFKNGPDHKTYPSYPEDWEKYPMGWLQKKVQIPSEWKGDRILLHFEAVAGKAEVYVNGNKVCENFDLFLPFDADITEHVEAGEEATIQVGVRSAKLFENHVKNGRRVVPAGSFWGQHIVGIWQDVYLHAVPQVRIDNVFIKPFVADEKLELELTLKNTTAKPVQVSVSGLIREWINLAGKSTLAAPVPKWELGEGVLTVEGAEVSIAASSETKTTLTVSVPAGKLKLWSPKEPNLYGLLLSLDQSGERVDTKYERFGWRQWTIEGDKHCLNGKPIELRGDSWHFQGIPQMTRRYAWAWYQAIKDANGNAVRPHAQVYPRFYMEIADEMGICVLSETSNWASDGGPNFDSEFFWEASDEHLRRLILRDRNFASVFGWSLTNENRPVMLHVFNRPDLVPIQIEAWKRWVEMCHELDPTRPWISGDGEGDGDNTLPTAVGHYGDQRGMKNLASKGKPWGVGEHSMAYYGTPKQVARVNGPRAYESSLGRMEGLAYECYKLIRWQRELDAAYASVFNLAWYALKPLELGMEDPSQSVDDEDGIFFTRPYVEGQPGIQPERLGPYCTTLNPGYDPNLPLYNPWPMFEAIRDANAPGGPAESKWANVPDQVSMDADPAEIDVYKVVRFAGDSKVDLERHLHGRGVQFSEAGGTPKGSLTIIDGRMPISKSLAKELRILVKGGMDVLVWGLTEESVDSFSMLLPHPVKLTKRDTSSLVIKSSHPIVSGMTHADFYFSEIQKSPVMTRGLAGPFVDNGIVILEACNANWREWNQVGESAKTAKLVRSERESKPAGTAMVQCQMGKGTITVNTLTEFDNTDFGIETLRKMLANAGVALGEVDLSSSQAVISSQGVIKSALALGSFEASDMKEAFEKDFLGGESEVQPTEGMVTAGKTWKTVGFSLNSDNRFDFKSFNLDGPKKDTAAYLSFWIWSPRPLDDLLLEPDMPHLDMVLGADDSCKVWLNGKQIVNDFGVHPLNPEAIRVEDLPLKQGWNHFMVKVVQGGGDWLFAGRFETTENDPKKEFVKKLKADLVNPDQ